VTVAWLWAALFAGLRHADELTFESLRPQAALDAAMPKQS
jgi:hypothetical protein